MIRLVLFALLTALAFLLDPIVASELGGATFRPNVLLIPLLVAIFAWPGSVAVVCGACIGLICDCLAGHALGPQAAAFAILAAIGSLVPPRPLSTSGLLFSLLIEAFAAELVASSIRLTFEGRPFIADAIAPQAAATALSTALLLSAVWFLARSLAKPFVRRPRAAGRAVSIGWQRTAD